MEKEVDNKGKLKRRLAVFEEKISSNQDEPTRDSIDQTERLRIVNRQISKAITDFNQQLPIGSSVGFSTRYQSENFLGKYPMQSRESDLSGKMINYENENMIHKGDVIFEESEEWLCFNSNLKMPYIVPPKGNVHYFEDRMELIKSKSKEIPEHPSDDDLEKEIFKEIDLMSKLTINEKTSNKDKQKKQSFNSTSSSFSQEIEQINELINCKNDFCSENLDFTCPKEKATIHSPEKLTPQYTHDNYQAFHDLPDSRYNIIKTKDVSPNLNQYNYPKLMNYIVGNSNFDKIRRILLSKPKCSSNLSVPDIIYILSNITDPIVDIAFYNNYINNRIKDIIKSKQGNKLIQRLIPYFNQTLIYYLYSEIFEDFNDIVTDQYGTSLCQFLYQYLDSSLKFLTKKRLLSNLQLFSTNIFSLSLLIKILNCIKNVKKELRSSIINMSVYAICNNFPIIVFNEIAIKYINAILTKFPEREVEPIYWMIINQLLVYSTHKFASQVVKTAILQVKSKHLSDNIMGFIIKFFQMLSEHTIGSKIVSTAVESLNSDKKFVLILTIETNYNSLAKSKYGNGILASLFSFNEIYIDRFLRNSLQTNMLASLLNNKCGSALLQDIVKHIGHANHFIMPIIANCLHLLSKKNFASWRKILSQCKFPYQI